MWEISILVDFRPMGYKLSCCGSCLGKNFLFKSALGHCVFRSEWKSKNQSLPVKFPSFILDKICKNKRRKIKNYLLKYNQVNRVTLMRIWIVFNLPIFLSKLPKELWSRDQQWCLFSCLKQVPLHHNSR